MLSSLGPVRTPSDPSDISGGLLPSLHASAHAASPLVEVPAEMSIEDGIRMGMARVVNDDKGILLRLKKIDLDIQPSDTFESIYARYKELEFNAFAADYERDFIQRNIAMYSVVAETLRRVAAQYSDPLRMLDIGCGTGFGLREVFAERSAGRYIGIDPAEMMLQVCGHTAKRFPQVRVDLLNHKAGVLKVDTVPQDILEKLGDRPHIIGWLAAMHVVNKHEPVGPLLERTKELLDPTGRVVIGNYFHRSHADFEAFRERYMRTMTHQPTPPAQLFNPEQMEAMLRSHWLEMESCQEMVCTDGLKAYVMVAKHKS